VVRRELSDNFCFYQEHYDSLEGAAGWAQDSLALHSKDHREWTYDETQLENAATHDDLWNAAQVFFSTHAS
jgi:deoxyribodipyrimidine photo-lyase